MPTRARAAALGVAFCLAGAFAANAATFDYTATLELQLANLDPFTLESSGQIDVSPDGSFTFPAGLLTTTRTLIPPQTSYQAIASIGLQLANGVGSFRGPGSPGGTMRLTGQAVLNLQTFLGVPPLSLDLSPIGGTGTATAMGSNGMTTVTASILGTPWQTGMIQQTGISSSGSTITQRTLTGEDLRTSGGEGIVTLVVPAYFVTKLDGVPNEINPISGTLSITFTPEPAPLIADAAMLVVVLVLHQRARRRRAAEAGRAEGPAA